MIKEFIDRIFLRAKEIIPFNYHAIHKTWTPVIKLNIDDKDGYFIVDTGCNQSLINNTVDVTNKVIVNTYDTYGIGGKVTNHSYMFDVKLKDKTASCEFAVADLNVSFDSYVPEIGIKPTGLLGSDFLCKFGCQLDFKDYKMII